MCATALWNLALEGPAAPPSRPRERGGRRLTRDRAVLLPGPPPAPGRPSPPAAAPPQPRRAAREGARPTSGAGPGRLRPPRRRLPVPAAPGGRSGGGDADDSHRGRGAFPARGAAAGMPCPPAGYPAPRLPAGPQPRALAAAAAARPGGVGGGCAPQPATAPRRSSPAGRAPGSPLTGIFTSQAGPSRVKPRVPTQHFGFAPGDDAP